MTPCGEDISAAVTATLHRAESFVRRLPNGSARLPKSNLLILAEAPADPALGLYLACTNSEVYFVTPDEPKWDDSFHPHYFEALAHRIDTSLPRLDSSGLKTVVAKNYQLLTRFQVLCFDPMESIKPLTDRQLTFDIVFVDGVMMLERNPERLLRHIREVTTSASAIVFASKGDEAFAPSRFDQIRQLAVRLGFGIRHSGYVLSLEEHNTEPKVTLGLVRLDTPMTDFPVTGRENPQVMGHCLTRLDVGEQIAKDKRILDAGGGTGLGGKRYLDGGARSVVSLDISQEAIAIGKKTNARKGLKFVQWDLNHAPLPFRDEEFDLVVCMEALEHITQQRQAIHEFFRVLKPGGQLLVSVPSQRYEQQWACVNGYDNPYHLHVPTREELAHLLEEAAFEGLRWLRQMDIFGSIMIEECCGGSEAHPIETASHRFAVTPGWSMNNGVAQVFAALATRPARVNRSGADDEDHRVQEETKPSSRDEDPMRSTPLGSDLHVWSNATGAVMEASSAYHEMRARSLEMRFENWCRLNEARGEIETITRQRDENLASLARQSELQRKAEDARVAAETMLDSLRESLDRERKEHREHLEQSRAAHESLERQYAAKEAANESASRQLQEHLQRELETSRAELTRRDQSLSRYDSLYKAIEAQYEQGRILSEQNAEQLRQRLEVMQRELSQRHESIRQYESLVSRLEQQLKAMREEARALTGHHHIERMALISELSQALRTGMTGLQDRCMTLDSRLYDVEDQLADPKGRTN